MKQVLFSSLFIFCALFSSAQDSSRWDIGIITGLQRTFYSNENSELKGIKFTPANEMVNGLMVNFDINPYLLVEADLLHSQKEFEYEIETGQALTINTKHSYLGLPVMLKSGFGGKWKVSIISGLSYQVAIGQSIESSDNRTITEIKASDWRANISEIQSIPSTHQLLVNAGLGVRLPIEDYFQFYTSTRYSKSLTPVYADGTGTFQHLIVLFGVTANI